MRDYQAWHRRYDDPDSGISWRLGVVRRYLDRALDLALDQALGESGSVRLLSLCAGDGRDVIGTLATRDDTERVSGLLVELDADIAAAARDAISAAGLDRSLEVRAVDAARPAGYADGLPADIVLLVGIFGNIADDDLWRTIDTAPAFCAPGATLIWSRGRDRNDRNDRIRARFADRGFTELAYDERDAGSRPALGAFRYDGTPATLDPEAVLFTFFR